MIISGDIPVDMICQFTKDGYVIPIKVRMPDEDGEYQEYKIQGFREKSDVEGCKNAGILSLECRLITYGQIRIINLIFFSRDYRWIYRK